MDNGNDTPQAQNAPGARTHRFEQKVQKTNLNWRVTKQNGVPAKRVNSGRFLPLSNGFVPGEIKVICAISTPKTIPEKGFAFYSEMQAWLKNVTAYFYSNLVCVRRPEFYLLPDTCMQHYLDLNNSSSSPPPLVLKSWKPDKRS